MYPGWSARDNYAIHKKRRKRKVKQVDSKGEDSVEQNKEESEVLEKRYIVNCVVLSLCCFDTVQDKDVSIGKLSPLTTTSIPPSSLSPLKATPTSNQHTDEEEIGMLLHCTDD